ncbi:MAG: HU family DNA-binding protein [Bacteroidales bacterium]|nr:HU family DNA-binding protein [Bacteroidales bacterium]MBO5133273.1 HU family DNA-binding protein [Paludibacteraceae bacterium]
MNTKEINTEIKKRLEVDSKVLDELMDSLSVIIKNEVLEGNSIALQGFGTFELRKKSERISVNPTTKQRMLVPPKQTLSFKPSSILKEKFNQEN